MHRSRGRPGARIEWPYVGSVQAHTKYSLAGDITAWPPSSALFRVQDNNITAAGTMGFLAGWTYESPRGSTMIDSSPRDIVHARRVHGVTKEEKRFENRVLGSIPRVRDACKALELVGEGIPAPWAPPKNLVVRGP